ncbi:transcriptional regulator [Rathayibacter iranicus]|uniref:MarR family transcriptional regulator n=2 Tax=Rathayibacter iranicus TaxID=59737 RepID=A0AAD1AHQ4_9MICO|nr:transcriptional regulator [Rathayibacter iranicus]AZZ56904.1 MarR family transcriptional regulator [Rathayibacter iranicus]MWV29502.1 helix-turn-helix domain-containing protein [Rathayibacter iranicus NCPPB 2253 = VKM Ac-1602]PPI42417.1 MarR family transcriptional regulator [Rathayibacter iranicus]PPI57839.1 MarR family transcriptional regulator [Rathayibacter iranicus]PPI68777.1 MarR family transcriptional regulator [Rathayibacter iranicus]
MTRVRFDSVIHPEQRIRICAFLFPNDEVAFSVMREALGMSESALSRQVKILVEAGYVSMTRETGVPRPRSWVALTPEGRGATKGHLQALQQMVADSDQ